jgi:putative restriction endonuclease
MSKTVTKRQDWTREQLLVALNLYTKLSFGRFDKSNRVVIEVAERLGRTPSSLAMKLSNFASLDPFHIARGVKGLSGASNLDREMWAKFCEHRAELAPESETIFRALFTKKESDEVEVVRGKGVVVTRHTAPQGPTEIIAATKVRRGQQFFRQSVLNRFENRCGVTGIAIRRLLVASHIVPWSADLAERLNPSNGLCLSSLHDAAFDSCLTTFDEDYRLVVSKDLRAHFGTEALRKHFEPYVGQRLAFSEKAPPPSSVLLAKHRARFKN